MLKIWKVVFIKEIKNAFRDKKTLFATILFPLLFTTIILFATDHLFDRDETKDVKYNIAANNVNNSFMRALQKTDSFVVKKVNEKSVEESIRSEKILVYFVIDKDFDHGLHTSDQSNKMKIIAKYNGSSIRSLEALSAVTSFSDEFNKFAMDQQLSKYNITASSLKKLSIHEDDISSATTSSVSVNLIIPMMLLLYCCLGAAGTATEVTAGEKERGTLEPLLASGASRSGIVLGKIFATALIGMIAGIFSVSGVLAYCIVSRSKVVVISLPLIISLMAIAAVTSVFFAAIHLMLGIYSRSNKESQTYSSLLEFVALAPSVFTYMLDLNNVPVFYYFVPLLNTSCIIKEGISGVFNLSHILLSFFTLIVCTALIFFISVLMFKKEKVIFRI